MGEANKRHEVPYKLFNYLIYSGEAFKIARSGKKILEKCRISSHCYQKRTSKKGKRWGEVLDYGLVRYLCEVIILNNPLL